MRITTKERGIALLSIVTLMVKYGISASSAYSNANDIARIKVMVENGIDVERARELCTCQPRMLVHNESVPACTFEPEAKVSGGEDATSFDDAAEETHGDYLSLFVLEDYDLDTSSIIGQLRACGSRLLADPNVKPTKLSPKAAANRKFIAEGLVRDLRSIEQSPARGNKRGPLPEDFLLYKVVSRQAPFCLFDEAGDIDPSVLSILKSNGFTYDHRDGRIYTNKGWLSIKTDVAPVDTNNDF